MKNMTLLLALLGVALSRGAFGDVTVDGGATRIITAADTVRAPFVIGASKGVGTVSTLKVESGGQLLGKYSYVSLGCAAGATGVVWLAGGELPASPSAANVENMSYLTIGESGAGFFTNDTGKVYLRESCLLGAKPGSFGRYVHEDGEFHFCFGGKPFAVGVLGQGEADAVSGRMDLQDVLIGGTNDTESVFVIREGATVAADARVSVGGYTNRMNRKCLDYPHGRGRIDLRGGVLSLESTSADIAAPILLVGQYPTSRGEIRGWGILASPLRVNRAYLGFGHGRIIADGAGEERCLDFSAAAGVTNLYHAADAGWAATNGGALFLPAGRVYTARNGTATGRLGASANAALPDLAGSAMVKVASSNEATHIICGELCALDRHDANLASLPESGRVLALWRLGDATTSTNWTAHPQAFKTASVTFAYDPASLTATDSRLTLHRRQGGVWTRVATSPANDSHTIATTSLTPLTDESYNIGTFALVEEEPFHGNVTGALEPDDDGWTEIGNLAYLTNAVDGSVVADGDNNANFYQNMAVPDWRAITLAEPRRVRFVGGTMLMDELPADTAYDFSQVVSLVTTTNRIFSDGSPIRVPTGARYRFIPSIAEADPETGKITLTLDTRTGQNRLQDNLVLDGRMNICDTTGSLVFDGDFSGSGYVRMFNFYRTLTLTGTVDFDGEIYLGQVQNNVIVAPRTARSAHIGKATICSGGSYWKQTTELVWTPCVAGDALSVDTIVVAGGTGLVSGTTRYGSTLRVKGNGAVKVGRLSTSGSGEARGLHLAVQGQTANADVTIGEIASATYVYMHPSVDLTVGQIDAATVFDCSALGTATNGASFRVTGPHPASCRLIASTPRQLPLEIAGYTGRVEVTSAAYELPVDTTHCHVIPAGAIVSPTGTVTVALASELPAPGRYDVLAWAEGCALADAAAWTFVTQGRASLCTLERSATGLTLVVPEVAGGVTFYVDDATGDDAADGISPDTAWKTLTRVNAADIRPGEKVLFRRGGLWRGQLRPKSGRADARVTYGAYGAGEKPILQYSAAADAPGAWVKVASGIWRSNAAFPIATYRDIGNIIFNHGEAYGWKRWSLETLANERDYWYDRNAGYVYIKSRCDPTTQWSSIELAIDQHVVSEGSCSYVTYDGLAVRYGSAHGFGGGPVVGITIQNCDISWIGGGVLSTTVKDDGTVSYTRYGNGIEFWGASRDCLVVSNRLWEIYDAALTDQSDVGNHTNVTWSWNTVWNAEYSYEHFNRSKDYSVTDITVEHNTFVDSGGAWAHAQRPDVNGAPLMIWYSSGPVTNFVIRNNIFVGSTQQGIRQTTDWHTRVTFQNNLFQLDDTPVVRLVNTFLDFDGYKALGWDLGSIEADPLFVDRAARDYRLRVGSPAIGLATDGLSAGAYAEPVRNRLYYAPSSAATAKNTFGQYVYVAENWTNALGLATRPQAGDVLVTDRYAALTANPETNAVPLGGLCLNALSCVNQGTLALEAGGPGVTNANWSSAVYWYAGLELSGDGDIPFYVGPNAVHNFQRTVNQTDGRTATLVKRGAGRLSFSDSSNYSPSGVATWRATRLEAGELRWSLTGAGGKAYDIQTFPVGHALTFADDGSCDQGAVFSLGLRDVTWRDIDLSEAASGRRRHVVTTASATNVCLRFTGQPKANPLLFSGAFEGRAGIWWNPDAATAELRLTRATSTTTGDITVSRGTVRLADGASFRALASVTVDDGATFAADATAGAGTYAARLVLNGTARLAVGAGVSLAFGTATADGETIPAATYTTQNCDWLVGDGTVVIGTATAGVTLWNVPSGETNTVADVCPAIGATRLVKTGTGALAFVGRKTFVCDMSVSNGVVVATGDESLGEPPGVTTFELYSTKEKGVLKVVCAAGTNEVSFHRPITFHYNVCGEWGSFMDLPANATVNFYGLMQTSCANCKGDPWPCHWRYTCPASTVVNWYGGMKAALNHEFPGGTHYIHKPLTGGDRFVATGGARVVLLTAGNSIGAATGSLSGGARLETTVPYALTHTADGRNQTLVIGSSGTLDLCGCDQALAVLSSFNGASGLVTSDRDAILHIRGAYALSDSNGGYQATVTNRVRFAGRAGLSMERSSAKAYPLVLTSPSTSTGELRVVSNRLILAPGCAWPNCSKATLAGGELALETAALGAGTTVSFEDGDGRLRLARGVVQKVSRLLLDGVPQRPGTYGSTASPATFRDDTRFTGEGLLRVGEWSGFAVSLR